MCLVQSEWSGTSFWYCGNQDWSSLTFCAENKITSIVHGMLHALFIAMAKLLQHSTLPSTALTHLFPLTPIFSCYCWCWSCCCVCSLLLKLTDCCVSGSSGWKIVNLMLVHGRTGCWKSCSCSCSCSCHCNNYTLLSNCPIYQLTDFTSKYQPWQLLLTAGTNTPLQDRKNWGWRA